MDVIHSELEMDNSSAGNETESGLPSAVVTRVAAGITAVFLIVGLVGNVLVIAAVARKKNLRTRGNAFIVSLSVVGLLYVFFVLIPGVDALIYRAWRSGDFICGFHTYYTLAFSLLSLLHTMCIGLDRLVNVVLFTRARKIASRRNIGIAVALCWLATLTVMMCYHFFVVAGRMYYLEKALRCIEIYNANSWRVSVAVYCFIYILPSIVIVASYVTILSFVKRKRKSLHSNMGVATRAGATSVTNGEAMSFAVSSDNRRRQVTFEPVVLPEKEERIPQCPGNPNLTAKPESPTEVDTGQASNGSELGAAASAHRCSIADAVYHTPVNIDTVDFSPGNQELSPGRGKDRDGPAGTDLSATHAEASADRIGQAASGSQSGRGSQESGVATTRQTRVRLLSTGSDVPSVRSAPARGDLPRRRGSIWPGQVAKTLGRGRDRFKPPRSRNDRDLNRMMLAVFLVVWVGYIPFPLIRYLDVPGIVVSSNVYMVVTVTSYVAGCVNPIIYGFMHRRFRAAFIDMLTLGKCKNSNRVGTGRDGSVSGTEGSTAVQQVRREEA